MFSSAKRLESVEYFSLAMIQHIRNELLNGDFSHNVRLLQVNFDNNYIFSFKNYPEVDISLLIQTTLSIQNEHLRSFSNCSGSLKSNQSLKSNIRERFSPARKFLKSKFTDLMKNTREKLSKLNSSES